MLTRPLTSPAAIRRALLMLFTFAALGTGIELILLGHTEQVWQWVPVVLTFTGTLAAAGFAFIRAPIGRRAFQATMMLFVLSGAIGLGLHYQGNVEFALEMEPGARGWTLMKEALTGATPALAPGTMVLLGAIGLIAASISENEPV
jgi:hypothetical protein